MGNKGSFLNTTGHSREGSDGDSADLALRLGLCQEKCINLFLATSEEVVNKDRIINYMILPISMDFAQMS